MTVLVGQSGAGKSQVAADYARERAAAGWIVIWIDASDRAGIELELSNAARNLGIASRKWEMRAAADLLRDFLQSIDEPALIVFDGAYDWSSLDRWIPSAGPVHVVVTSVFAGLGERGRVLPVASFSYRSADRYLKARMPALFRQERRELIRTVGPLPAALWSATGVIRGAKMDVSEYVQKFGEGPLSVAFGEVGRPSSAAQTLRAVSQSVDSFLEQNKSSMTALPMRELLTLSALIAPVETDPRLFHGEETFQGPRLIAPLVEWSLGNWDITESTVSLHDLPARLVRERLDKATLGRAIRTFVALARAGLDDARNSKEESDSLVQYLTRATESLARNSQEDMLAPKQGVTLSQLRIDLAKRAFDLGDFVTVETVAASVVSYASHSKHDSAGSVHLEALGLLAHAELAYGEKAKAIASYRLYVKAHADASGSASPDTLRATIGLGNALRADGQIEEAIEVLNEVLSKELPPDLESEAKGSLGFALLRRGELEAAETILREVVAEREERLGLTNLSTLIAMNNLGHCLLDRKDPSAVTVLRDAFEGKRDLLGIDHPQSLLSSHYLGLAEATLGGAERGWVLLEDTLERRTRVLGPHHPATLSTKALIQQLRRPGSLASRSSRTSNG